MPRRPSRGVGYKKLQGIDGPPPPPGDLVPKPRSGDGFCTRDGEFVADLAPYRADLGEAQMVGVGGFGFYAARDCPILMSDSAGMPSPS